MHGTEQQLAGWCWIPDSIRALIYCQSGKLTPSVFKQCPWWQQLAQISSTESAQASGKLLFVTIFKLTIQNLYLLSQSSVINAASSSPIHPAEANGPGELRSPQDRCGVGTLSLLESSYAASPLKYGAGWKKEELPEKDFRDYSLVLFP